MVVSIWLRDQQLPLTPYSQERCCQLRGLAHGNSYCQTSPPLMVPPTRYRSRSCVHSLWLLLCRHETVRLVHVARSELLCPLLLDRLTNMISLIRLVGEPVPVLVMRPPPPLR